MILKLVKPKQLSPTTILLILLHRGWRRGHTIISASPPQLPPHSSPHSFPPKFPDIPYLCPQFDPTDRNTLPILSSLR
jgi:hypothetical protein